MKVIGKPKPEVKWLREDEEIIPSEEYQIENKPDGTSVLIIKTVNPEDTGKITFEAHNPVGVAETETELVVEGICFSRRKKIYSFLALYILTCEKFIQQSRTGSATLPNFNP